MKITYTEHSTQTITIDLPDGKREDMVDEDGELTPEGRTRVYREIAVHGYDDTTVHDTSVSCQLTNVPE